MKKDLDATKITMTWPCLDVRIRCVDAADALTLAAAAQMVAKKYCGYTEPRVEIEGIQSKEM